MTKIVLFLIYVFFFGGGLGGGNTGVTLSANLDFTTVLTTIGTMLLLDPQTCPSQSWESEHQFPTPAPDTHISAPVSMSLILY